MRRRRGSDDNVDLSSAEHAWWAGGERRLVSAGPPPGIPERRAEAPAGSPVTARAVAAGPVTAGPVTEGAVANPPPPVVVAPPTPPLDPDDAAAAAAAARAAIDPARDPWRRSTSPHALAAYRTLGIDWEANWDEVVAVFKEQAARWHPDRLAGADPQVQAEGERRMSEMTRAYRELQRILRPQHRKLFTT